MGWMPSRSFTIRLIGFAFYFPPNDPTLIIAKLNFHRCASTGKAIPKDKAIKRFIVRNIVDASSLRDIKEASAYQEYQLPKLYLKMYYCVEAAVHQRIVRGRSKEDRKIRTPPERKFVRKA
jgi:small subunit ribosomal protein S26e